jgi:hypothetical protein
MRPRSRDATRPKLYWTTRLEVRAWGTPGANRTRSLAWENKNHTSVVTARYSRIHPAFPHAMVLTVSFALSSVTGLSCHRRLADIWRIAGPVGRMHLRSSLTPASGRQDHTTSPYAISVVRLRAPGSLTAKPPCDP